MHKQIFLSILFSIFLFSGLQAQIASRTVIASGGGTYTANNLQVSTTIGEPLIETLSSNDLILTQGFQQSRLTVVGVQHINQHIFAKVYPNPTASAIILETKNATNIVYELVSIDGKILASSKILEETTRINMDLLPADLYLLRLFSKDGKIGQVIKIQKN